MNKFMLSIVLLLGSTMAYADSVHCMAKAIYFESRGGDKNDQLAVAHTVMNRVDSSIFPNTVCGVVRQPFQFSPNIVKDVKIKEPSAWQRAKKYAKMVLNGESKDFTNGATFFHTPAVNPKWSRKFNIVHRNKQHIFYRH